MKVIESSIRYPVSVTVGVLLLALFGMLALLRIPVQLIPDVEIPQAIVTTAWPGASPEEVETEIVQKQEEQLKSLEGLEEMTSTSAQSVGTVKLRFTVGTDPESALLQVSNRLQQVQRYPDNVLKPVITSKDPFEDQMMAWIALLPLPGVDLDIEQERQFAAEVVKPAIERVAGVAAATVFGGRDRQLKVIVDPQKLAVRGIALSQVAAALAAENRDVSAGDFDEGKRRYVVRTVGQYTSPLDVEDVVLTWRDGAPVYVRDVATVELGYGDPESMVRDGGQPSIGVTVVRAAGSNTIAVDAGLRQVVDELNAGPLKQRGLRATVDFSEAGYIERAISLVQQNILVGGALAIGVLLLFLRSISSTMIIGMAIPVCIVGTFLAMTLLGRNINVVSLAGLAFAVGMIVDASIVVLENIYRHMQMGKRRAQAAYDGAVEVWGAVLASVLTTVAVFVPVLFMQEEVGQLFRDIAVAIAAAVSISLVVSITVIPSMASRMLHAVGSGSEVPRGGWRAGWGLIGSASRARDALVGALDRLTGSVALRLVVIVTLTSGALFAAWSMMPDIEYLPTGNQNFAFGVVIPPPGYNIDEYTAMAARIESKLRPYWEAKPGTPEAEALGVPPLEIFFFASFQGGAFMGGIGYPEFSERTGDIVPVMQAAVNGIPGTIAVVQQPSIFQRGADPGRAINVDFSGPDLEPLLGMGARVFGAVMATMPGAQAQPIPGLDLGNPEVRVIPDRERAAELGFTTADLGFALDALVDGVKVSEYLHEGRTVDLMLLGAAPYAARSQHIGNLSLATPTGRVVSVGDVGRIVETNGAVQINRIERRRAVTIQVTPPRDMPLEAAMRHIDETMLEPMRADGTLAPPYAVRLAGTADKLTQTRRALQGNVVLALVVTYLLMASLFESFLYPFVILFSVPFAAVGGFIGLAVVNAFVGYQALDVVAMLGFVILIGVVVNNAILIVHQTLNYMRSQDLDHREALRDAVSDRVRPILMSTLTSVMGMTPLVLVSGAGSEIYRGLGSVVVGGLLVSMLFTLILVPAVFSLAMDARESIRRRIAGTKVEASA